MCLWMNTNVFKYYYERNKGWIQTCSTRMKTKVFKGAHKHVDEHKCDQGEATVCYLKVGSIHRIDRNASFLWMTRRTKSVIDTWKHILSVFFILLEKIRGWHTWLQILSLVHTTFFVSSPNFSNKIADTK